MTNYKKMSAAIGFCHDCRHAALSSVEEPCNTCLGPHVDAVGLWEPNDKIAAFCRKVLSLRKDAE